VYKRLEIRPEDREGPADNFPSPVMAGGLFAISAKFFWELGGYDSGLDIWGVSKQDLKIIIQHNCIVYFSF
jgi:polypeptide N-acetylgalactosaminyltransferase